MSLDEIVAVLDVDGDGVIDEAEWLAQLEKIPALKASIEQAVDPATGKIVGYRTLEEQLAKVMRQAAELEAKAAAGEDVAEELEKRRASVAMGGNDALLGGANGAGSPLQGLLTEPKPPAEGSPTRPRTHGQRHRRGSTGGQRAIG